MSGPVFNGDFLPSAVQTLADLKYLPTPQGVMQLLGSTAVGDGSGGLYYWDSTSTETSDDYNIVTSSASSTGRWKLMNPVITLNASTYGVIGDGTTDCYAGLVAVVAKAKTLLATYGKPVEIVLPPGDLKIINLAPIDFNDGFRYSDSPQGAVNSVFVPSMRGAGMYATRLKPQTAGMALFRIYGPAAGISVVGQVMSDFSIWGPGKSNASTVGIQYGGVSATYTNGVGSCQLLRVRIADCGTCIRMDDNTGQKFSNLILNNFGYGIEFGYNCDLNVFDEVLFYGDFKTPSNVGTGVGMNSWTPPFNTRGSGNAIAFRSCQFLLLVNCLDVEVNTSNVWLINSYFERCNKIAKLGTAADTGGMKQFIVNGCHFSQASTATYGLTSAAIEVLGTGGSVAPHISLQGVLSDTTPTQQWVLGFASSNAGRLLIQNCILPSSHANGAVSWGPSNFAIPSSGDLIIGGPETHVFNSATVPTVAKLTTWRAPGSGKILEKWNSVTSAATPVEQGTILQVEVLDASSTIAVKGIPLVYANAVSRPAAAAAYQGMLWVTAGTAGVADTLDFCLKNSADAYAWGSLQSGTYTPTLTAGANVAASTARLTQFMRVGNTVTVAGELDLDATTTLTNTVLGISLPIASAFANTFECGGTAVGSTAGTTVGQAGRIYANVANDRAELQVIPVIVSNDTYSFTFTYQVI